MRRHIVINQCWRRIDRSVNGKDPNLCRTQLDRFTTPDRNMFETLCAELTVMKTSCLYNKYFAQTPHPLESSLAWLCCVEFTSAF